MPCPSFLQVMACCMLKCLEAFQPMPIVRSRDGAEIDGAAIVVDVGGSYEAAGKRFDHHQKGFEETYSEAMNKESGGWKDAVEVEVV